MLAKFEGSSLGGPVGACALTATLVQRNRSHLLESKVVLHISTLRHSLYLSLSSNTTCEAMGVCINSLLVILPSWSASTIACLHVIMSRVHGETRSPKKRRRCTPASSEPTAKTKIYPKCKLYTVVPDGDTSPCHFETINERTNTAQPQTGHTNQDTRILHNSSAF